MISALKLPCDFLKQSFLSSDVLHLCTKNSVKSCKEKCSIRSKHKINQGPCIDFQFVPPQMSISWRRLHGGRRRGNFVFWFYKTQENAFIDGFSKNFVLYHKFFFSSVEKWRGHGPPSPFGCAGLCKLPQEILTTAKKMMGLH